MSDGWVLALLVPCATISLWCLLWCCMARTVSQRVHPKAFTYNPVQTTSPRTNPVSTPVTSPSSPVSPVVVVTTPHRAAQPGLHFIDSATIYNE